MEDETIIIRGWVSTNMCGSKCEFEAEFDKADWDDMSYVERDKEMLEAMWESGIVDWSYDD